MNRGSDNLTIQTKPYELTGSLPVTINARWAERVLLLLGLLFVDLGHVAFWILAGLLFSF